MDLKETVYSPIKIAQVTKEPVLHELNAHQEQEEVHICTKACKEIQIIEIINDGEYH